MTTEVQTLRNPFEGGKVLNETQLKVIEKAYHELKVEVIAQDKELSTKQISKLKGSLDNLKTIHSKAVGSKKQCESRIQGLKKQLAEYDTKINEHERMNEKANGQTQCKARIAQGAQKHVHNCQQRIRIAREIDINAFKKLQIEERSSPANELFRWMIVSLYGEPENKFYWPNFKEQAIEYDEGRDLLERLGKIDAFHAKEDQRVKTVKLVQQEKTVKQSPQFKKYEKQVNGIFEIAKLFLSSAELGRDKKQLEKDIIKFQELTSKSDQQHLQHKNTHKAIQQRIRVSEAYLHQLVQMEKLLNAKLDKYNTEIALGQTYIGELSKISTYVQEYKVMEIQGLQKHVSVPAQQKRDTCECQIY